MLIGTIDILRCPSSHSEFCKLTLTIENSRETPKGVDIVRGELKCPICNGYYPIIMGVLILVKNLFHYFNNYINGILRFAKLDDVPIHFKKHYLLALENKIYNCNIQSERWEVNSWYIINNFFSKKEVLRHLFDNAEPKRDYIKDLVTELWDIGPFSYLERHLDTNKNYEVCVDLGCNVGGSIAIMHKHCIKCIGVDLSFSSIATARKIFYETELFSHQFVKDPLFEGKFLNVVLDIDPRKSIDFFVSDLRDISLAANSFDFALCMNVLDMIDNPLGLLNIYKTVLKDNGVIYYSSPYAWNETSSRNLRRVIHPFIDSSSEAIEWLFNKQGFQISEVNHDLPWLFLKQKRQLVIYSLHSFFALNS